MEEFETDFFHNRLLKGDLAGPGQAATRAPQKCCQQRAAHQVNQTPNQTFSGSLVPWPRLPRFANFPFHFPFRGEKGSAPLKNGLEQFQRPSRQHLRCRLHFNGTPLGISGQN